jgi:Protein of unknown function (DUF1449)
MVGLSISELIGKEFAVEAESHNALSGLFLWINAGRLPLLILIILVLGIFSIGGFLLQGLAHAAGTAIPVSIAAVVAAAGSIPVIRNTSRGLARIIPRDESYAVSDSDFVGKVDTVSARASAESEALPVGASVLLVDRDAKSFIAISAPADLVEQQHSSNRA